jgi:hypothetical protein
MSTSFQLAPWSYLFFTQTPNATAPLGALDPFHTRVQVINTSMPLTAPDTWDFTQLNTMFEPIQSTADHSPEFQIGTAPAFLSDSNGYILPTSYADFAQMSANLVRYYNTGGFSDSGNFFQSPCPIRSPGGASLTSRTATESLRNSMSSSIIRWCPPWRRPTRPSSFWRSSYPTTAPKPKATCPPSSRA